MSSLDIVVGAQFGSEAKGHVTKRILQRLIRDCNCAADVYNVRVAGPNAGHCVLDSNGVKFAMRSLPVGFVYPKVKLVIAAGSEVELAVLQEEIEQVEAEGHKVRHRLTIHSEATLLTDKHKGREATDGLVPRIGSTGKGIGAARADRIMRSADRIRDNEDAIRWAADNDIALGSGRIPTDAHVVIEGTQGYGLGLHAGYYPQCTSSNTRAIDFAAMAGVNPWDFDSYMAWAVARVHPIRVAGNSGPLKGETSWEDLGLPKELTTVTKKVRRVGEWDPDLVRTAVKANGRNTALVLTMLDHKFPHMTGVSNLENPGMLTAVDLIDEDTKRFIRHIEVDTEAVVALVTTGEDSGVWFN